MTATMTVKDLREKIANTRAAIVAGDSRFKMGLDEFDAMEIVVRVHHNDGDDLAVGGLVDVTIDSGCTEVFAFILDGDDDAKSARITGTGKKKRATKRSPGRRTNLNVFGCRPVDGRCLEHDLPLMSRTRCEHHRPAVSP